MLQKLLICIASAVFVANGCGKKSGHGFDFVPAPDTPPEKPTAPSTTEGQLSLDQPGAGESGSSENPPPKKLPDLSDFVGYWEGPRTTARNPNVRCVQHFYEIRSDWIGYDIEVHRGVSCEDDPSAAAEREFLKSALYVLDAKAHSTTPNSLEIAGQCRGTVSTCPEKYELTIRIVNEAKILINSNGTEEEFTRADRVRED
jgi:hypothetical protein